jgi:hypothetical protein
VPSAERTSENTVTARRRAGCGERTGPKMARRLSEGGPTKVRYLRGPPGLVTGRYPLSSPSNPRPQDERSQPAAHQQVKQRDQGQDPEYQEGRENDERHDAANTPPVVLAVILRGLLGTRSPRAGNNGVTSRAISRARLAPTRWASDRRGGRTYARYHDEEVGVIPVGSGS